jgi:hypothetical protein
LKHSDQGLNEVLGDILTTPLTTVYKCIDGTEFPVEWRDPEHMNTRWAWNDGHFPRPVTPFDTAIGWMTESSAQRAYADADIPHWINHALVPNGFKYVNRIRLSSEQQAADDARVQRFIDSMGGILAVWDDFCQPRTEESCNWVRSAGDETPTVDLLDAFGYGFHMTMVSARTVAVAFKQFADFLSDEFGSDAENLAIELTTGEMNETVMADQVLWEVAQLARDSDSLKNVIITNEPRQILEAISKVDGSTEFLTAFDDYRQRYGSRSTTWETAAPLVREQPEVSLSFIQNVISNDVTAPLEIQRGVLNAAKELAVDIENRLGTDDEKRAKFRTLLNEAKPLVSVRENRAYWQLQAFMGASGPRCFREGRSWWMRMP